MVEQGAGGEEFLGEEAINKFGLFAQQLAQWDSRIVEIVAVKRLAENNEEDKLDLICSFNPEPMDDAMGFFWIVNLLTRMEFEALDERLGICQPPDMGFKIGERVFLPNGKILKTMGDHIILWPDYEE
jgi:hypothetical protein